MPDKSQNVLNEFLKSFAESVTKTFSKLLDADNKSKVNFITEDTSLLKNTDGLEEDNAIYKIDYTTGSRNATLVVLIPEAAIAGISDLLTGGSGDVDYKGSLDELEINSMSNLLDKIFKTLETDFKQNYEHNLVFSTNPKLLLKSMPDYRINSDGWTPDLIVNSKLHLSEGKAFEIKTLLRKSMTEATIKDLGLNKTGKGFKKPSISPVGIKSISDVKINIIAELGKTQIPIKYALELVRGSMIELDTLNNADIKVYANGVEFARAQVVAVEDNFGLRITQLKTKEGFKSSKLSSLGLTSPIGAKSPAGHKKAAPTKPAGMSIPEKLVDIDAFAQKMKTKLIDVSQEIQSAQKDMAFDEKTAEIIANNAVKVGQFANLKETQLEELWLTAYYHDIGKTKLSSSAKEEKDFKKQVTQASYEILLSKKVPPRVTESLKFCVNCINNYRSNLFKFDEPMPYCHIISMVSYYQNLIAQKQTKDSALNIMLQHGGNKFNPFILHKFIRIVKEEND